MNCLFFLIGHVLAEWVLFDPGSRHQQLNKMASNCNVISD